MRNILPCVALAWLLCVPVSQAQTDSSWTLASPAEVTTDRAAALEACAEGQKLLATRNPADVRAALERFEKATAADSTLATAFAGLAEARALLFDYPKAKAAALRALALDDNLGAAHAVLAFSRLHGDWDWAGAETELRRSLEVEPRRAGTHLWYAILLEATGRSAEAVKEAQQAVELAPDQANLRAGLGYRLYWAGRYDEAVKELHAALEMDPGLETAHYFIGRSRVQQQRFDEARAAFARARELSPEDNNLVSAMGYLEARAGRRQAAARVLSDLEKLAARGLPFASQIAGIKAALGEKAAALEWLNRAYRGHEAALVWIKIDPRFESLRAEPGFREILQRMGL